MATVNRVELLQCLEMIRPGVSPRDILEQTSCVAFKKGWVFSFNGSIAVKSPVGLPKDFIGAVNAEKLIELLKKRPEDELEIKFTESRLTVTANRRDSYIALESEIKIPVDKVERAEHWKDLDVKFTEAIDLVKECASTDESESALACVHIHPKWVEACDDYQLARYRLATGIEKACLVKRTALKHVIDLGMSEFSETPNWIHFRNPNKLTLSCLRYVEVYPPIAEFFKVTGGSKLRLPKHLAKDTEIAELFSKDNEDGNYVEVSVKEGEMQIVGRSVSGGHRGRLTKVKYSGPDLTFYMAPKLLMEIASRYSDCEVTDDRMIVRGDQWVYVACLIKPDEAKGGEDGEGATEEEEADSEDSESEE